MSDHYAPYEEDDEELLNHYFGPHVDDADEDDFTRAERDYFDAPQRAEALALLRTSVAVHEARRLAMEDATDELTKALERADQAREAFLDAGRVVANATKLVAIVKGSRP